MTPAKAPVPPQAPKNLHLDQLKPLDPSTHIERPNWMRQYLIEDRQLKDICLPGTHDSATAILQREWTDERDNSKLMHVIPYTTSWWSSWYCDLRVWPAILGCARATNWEIKTQLLMGVRAFDFRVWRWNNAYRSVHTFPGQAYSEIAVQLRDFLESYKGEVVYASFRFLDGNHQLKDDAVIKPFLTWLTSEEILGKFCVRRDEVQGKPLQASYRSLVDGCGHSRIIIHFRDEDWRQLDVSKFPGRDRFFSNEEIGLHGDSNGNDSAETTVPNQKKYLQYAKDHHLCFSLWPVLAPDPAVCEREITNAAKPFFKYDAEVLRTVAKAVNANLVATLGHDFGPERVSAVFVDWIEDTPLIPLAINRSIGLTFITENYSQR